jgi:formylglycine-generating enzyme required for sulfatase activity
MQCFAGRTWCGEDAMADVDLAATRPPDRALHAPSNDRDAPNGHGVHDMIGNVWERTTDWYSQKHEADASKACCIPENPRGGPEGASYDPCQPNIRIPRKAIKGGSHLRTQLLPPLPAGRAPCAAGRYIDEPRRIPVYRA